MGLNKRDHIRTITKMERVHQAWRAAYGKAPTEDDVEAMYHAFLPIQLACIRDYGSLIDGTLEVVGYVRSRGMRIGSTTGYSREMMDILAPVATKQGYAPDCIVCASDVPEGRPAPFMIWANAIKLGLYPLSRTVKVGDTIADIDEGRAAGMWTIGLSRCGNELGLSSQDTAALPASALQSRTAAAEKRFVAAGAHYAVPSIGDVIPLFAEIERRIASGERP
jgi:phosphonoacetaldehyde hydrolase